MVAQRQVKDFSLRQAVWTNQFWILSAAYFGFLFYLQSVMIHIVPHAINMGISPIKAAIIITFIGGGSTAGRVMMGATAGRIGNKLATIISFILITFAAYILILSKEIWMFHLFGLIFGFGYGGLATMQSLLVADLFGLSNHGMILGTLDFIVVIGGGIGPLVAGYIFDLSGSYYTLLLILLAVSATASVLISLLRPTTDFT
jgi:MFS family permease